MADTLQFELVSPERSLASVAATQVQIPGAEGDFTAMPDHAPVITTLRPGILSVMTASGTDEYFVTGGFAEVSAEGASVLAERAYAKADVTADMVAEMVSAASDAAGSASADAMDAANKYAADMAAAKEALGL